MKFPHITELGLMTYTHSWGMERRPEEFVLASDLNHLLSQGVRVSGYGVDESGEWRWFKGSPGSQDKPDHYDTHTALLINIRPIQKPDSLEQLARDLAGSVSGKYEAWHYADIFKDAQKRARRLVGGK